MEVKITNSSDLIDIGVFGKVVKKSEIKDFIKILNEITYKRLTLTFFDAKTLPEIIIKKIIELSKKENLTIYVAQRFLCTYFYKLGIHSNLIKLKSVKAKNKNTFRAIALGGSAGSLEYLIYILNHLTLTNISIFIVQHLLENSKNKLAEILTKYTKYKIKEAEHNELIKDGFVYVAPAGFHLKIFDGFIKLSKEEPKNFARPSIDLLFESLSEYYRSALAVVLLSGYNIDGTTSLSLLKLNETTIIIQDPNECLQNELLYHAISTSKYDYIFPIPEITHYLNRHLPNAETLIKLDDSDIESFLEELYLKYGYDYRNYSKDNIKRLIIKELSNNRMSSFTELRKKVFEEEGFFESLFLTFSINVTEFFRNPKVFKFVKEKLFVYLNSYPQINIWCTSCSSGEEPYSLAILLKEEGLLQKAQIYATDINPYIVEQAKNGFFSKEFIEKNSANYLEAGGKFNFTDYFYDLDKCFLIKEDLKEKILFFEYSLLNKGILNEFNLIFCRNVLIYFNDTLFKSTIDLLYNSLSMSSFLVLGESEDLVNNNTFMVYNNKFKVYKKYI